MKQNPKTKNLNNHLSLKPIRKDLRKNLTPAEAKLWTYLKSSQLENRKFRRQHSIGNYILDFYCPQENLAVELDGDVHNGFSQRNHDKERDYYLQSVGIKVLRFENKFVFENLNGLLKAIKTEFGRQENSPPF